MPTRKDGHQLKQSTRQMEHLMAARHDMPVEARSQMIKLLNQQLADTFDLYSITKQAHWNVKGPQFISLHELFDGIAGRIDAQIDEIAERAVQLGGTAAGTIRQAAAASSLPEYPAGLTASPWRTWRRGCARRVRSSARTAGRAGMPAISRFEPDLGRRSGSGGHVACAPPRRSARTGTGTSGPAR